MPFDFNLLPRIDSTHKIDDPIAPESIETPTPELLREWIDAHPTPMFREIAEILARNITHISFEMLLEQLKISLDAFKNSVQDRPFCLAIMSNGKQKSTNSSSDVWMIGLAYKYCELRLPEAILSVETLFDYLEKNQIKDVLIIDDASYSGSQKRSGLDTVYNNAFLSFGCKLGIKSSEIEAISEQQKIAIKKQVSVFFSTITFHIAIPFMTTRSVQLKMQAELPLNFLPYRVMPTENELFNERQQLFLSAFDISLKLSLFYFDHRVADEISFDHCIRDGKYFFGTFSRVPWLIGEYMNTNSLNYRIYQIFGYNKYAYFPDTLTRNPLIPLIHCPYHNDVINNAAFSERDHVAPLFFSQWEQEDIDRAVLTGKIGRKNIGIDNDRHRLFSSPAPIHNDLALQDVSDDTAYASGVSCTVS